MEESAKEVEDAKNSNQMKSLKNFFFLSEKVSYWSMPGNSKQNKFRAIKMYSAFDSKIKI